MRGVDEDLGGGAMKGRPREFELVVGLGVRGLKGLKAVLEELINRSGHG